MPNFYRSTGFRIDPLKVCEVKKNQKKSNRGLANFKYRRKKK